MRQTYSMVFLDIDGTLLDSGHNLSPNTKRLLNRLEKRGIPIILCSARYPDGVECVTRQADLHSPIVCYGGALVLDKDRSILSDTGIEIQTAVRFKRFVDERFPELITSTYLYNVWLVDDGEHPDIRREAGIIQCRPLAGKLETAAQAMDHVHKLLCIGPPGQILRLQREAAPLFPEVELLSSGASYLEVLPKGVSKRTAMGMLQARYGLGRESAVACGDHFVDLEMLRYAGLGIAMGNAPEEVKAAADRVTASNDEEGVYIALKNLKFTPPPEKRAAP
nr:Cof-type HAD-IIB family hydrolase [uncultured Oscillibacter sp.]